MNGLDNALMGIIQRSAAHENAGDYYRDGLLYCGKCHTQKQCVVDLFGEKITVGCVCRCEQEQDRLEHERMRRQEIMVESRALRAQAMQDFAVHRHTFNTAEQTKNIINCQKYVKRWPEMLEHNNGLLFWGNVDTGKTFAAECIANAVIDMGVPVLVTNFSRILNSGWDKSEIVQQMKKYKLLVIDDLGAERESDYALEIVYFVIDERCKSKLPLITTTNLSLEEIKRPKNMRYNRIYSRLLEMCVPVYFDGKHYRQEKAAEKMRFAREVFG